MLWSEEGGVYSVVSSDDGPKKFFNRSPITLKFGAEKLERERANKERARARARERKRERERASCCSTLVS